MVHAKPTTLKPVGKSVILSHHNPSPKTTPMIGTKPPVLISSMGRKKKTEHIAREVDGTLSYFTWEEDLYINRHA